MVVKFKNNNYHLSGLLKCKECEGNFRGIMSVTNHRTKVKHPWYRCSSKGVAYIKCNNAGVSADAISAQVWDIIDVVRQNLHVIEELGDLIKLNSSQPEQVFLDELEELAKLLNKNLKKQKGLYEVFAQDKINLEIYKDRAELLRNEEKKLKQDIKAVQLKILDKRNSINLTRATQDFLLHLRKTSDNEQMDFLIKTFMRIIFKSIYIQNQEIVTFKLNEPWQTCYEEGIRWLKTAKIAPQTANPTEIHPANSACFWRPMDAR